MTINLRSSIARWVLIAVEFTAFLALLVWVSKTYVAVMVSREPTTGNFQLATKLDPGNSEYRLGLGRLLQYSLTDINPESAVRHLRRATELNPYHPQPWLDLAAALELQGKTTEAEACLHRAGFLAPNLPAIHWAAGNFFLLHGNVDEAFRHFKVVLAGSTRYNQIVFDIAWKASGDPTKILDELIPHRLPTEFSYLNYLVSKQRFPEAQSVWKRIADSSERFPPSQAAGYINKLLEAHRPAEAYQVWTDLGTKGLIRRPRQESSQNLILNGDLEEELLRMGFDWRSSQVEGVYTGLDQTTFHSASHALLIQFAGKQNVHYRHFYQYVRVAPARSYQLRAWVKTEDITTDSGPRLEVRDAYNSSALHKLSEDLTGSTTGWSLMTVDFTTGPTTDLIVVGVVRLPSRKLDNLIAGKVWVDDFTLTAIP